MTRLLCLLVLICAAAAVHAQTSLSLTNVSPNVGRGSIKMEVTAYEIYNNNTECRADVTITTFGEYWQSSVANMYLYANIYGNSIMAGTPDKGYKVRQGPQYRYVAQLPNEGGRKYILIKVEGALTPAKEGRIYIDEPIVPYRISVRNTSSFPVLYKVITNSPGVTGPLGELRLAPGESASLPFTAQGTPSLVKQELNIFSDGTGYSEVPGAIQPIGPITNGDNVVDGDGTASDPAKNPINWSNQNVADTTKAVTENSFREASQAQLDELRKIANRVSSSGGGSGLSSTDSAALAAIKKNTEDTAKALTENAGGLTAATKAEEPDVSSMPFNEGQASKVTSALGILPTAPELTLPTTVSAFAVTFWFPGVGNFSVNFDLSPYSAGITVFKILVEAGIWLAFFFMAVRAIKGAFAS